METRLDRYRKERRQNFFKFIKLIVILLLITSFSFLVFKVNETIIKLNVLENTELFTIDIPNRVLSLLGKNYIIKN